jgi:uracil-DNA glycosylase
MASRVDYLAALGVTDWQQRRPLVVSAARVEARVPAQAPAIPEARVEAVRRDAAPTAANRAATAPVVEVAPVQEAPRITEAPRLAPVDDSWDTVAAEVAGCTRCELHTCRNRTVFGVGNRAAKWLVVGEAPGADEDRQGEPFVGRAGQLLNSMLLGIGLKREEVFIANVLKCRPPNNRDPLPAEVAQCLPYLERQIALLKPSIMLAVGRIAAQNLLATDTPIGKLRSRVHAFGNQRIPLVVTYHPAYLLRSPTEKRKAWEDLKFARRIASGAQS